MRQFKKMTILGLVVFFSLSGTNVRAVSLDPVGPAEEGTSVSRTSASEEFEPANDQDAHNSEFEWETSLGFLASQSSPLSRTQPK